MTTLSLHESTGLSIHVGVSIVTGIGIPERRITDDLESLDKTESAIGGYNSLNVTINETVIGADTWLEYGIGSHIELYNQAMVKIWEGYVNSLDINYGFLSVSRGPLIDIANRVSVVYGLLDTAQNPPVQTIQTTTTIAEDADSQARWGIWEKILSAGQATAAGADEVRDTYLSEYAQPETSHAINTSSAQPITIALHCLGYAEWLDSGIYSQVAASGTTQLETKLAAILDDAGADPNGLFASTNADIYASGILVPQYEGENQPTRALIGNMITMGDGAQERMLWGVYNDREFRYSQIPTTALYDTRTMSDQATIVMHDSESPLYPWDVKAGQWLFLPDFLTGKSQLPSMRLDPRYIFIEQVQYTAPYTLSIQGRKIGKTSQLLARMGLGGI